MKYACTILLLMFITTSALFAQVNLEDGLVGYYKMDGVGDAIITNYAEGDNVAPDGEVIGELVWEGGIFNKGIHFTSGSGQPHVSLGTYDPSAGTNELSISVWIKWDGINGLWHGICAKRDAWDPGENMWSMSLDMTTGQIQFETNTAGGKVYIITPEAPPVGEWLHVVLTFDGTWAKFYFNGSLVVEGAMELGLHRDANFVFGCGEANGNHGFAGIIDELRFYNRAINEEEVNALFNSIPIWGGPHDGSNYLNFDGVDDYVNCGNDNSLQISGTNITLEAWIYPTEFKNEVWKGCVICKDENDGAANDAGYMLRVGANGIVNFNFGNNGWNELNSPANAVSLNTWHHIAATYDGSEMCIYVDSVKVASRAESLPIVNADTRPLYIGDSQQYGPRVFEGRIDEVRVWNITRTQQEIADNMYNFDLDSTSTGLQGYWQFNEGIGQITRDKTANGNDGILGSAIGSDKNDPSWIVSEYVFSIIVDGEKDLFYETLKGPGDGHVQITHFTYCNGQAPFGPRDIYSKVWTAWDSTYFYMYEEVLDQYLVLDNLDPRANDCLELHFDVSPWSSDSTVSNVSLSVLDSIDVAPAYWSGISNMEPQEGFGGAATYHDYVRKITSNGYVLELRIAWDSLYTANKSVNAGNYSIIGFAMNNNDNDWNGLDCSTMWSAVVDEEVNQNRDMLGYIQLLPDNKIKLSAANYLTGAVNPDSNSYNPHFVVGIKPGEDGVKPVSFILNQNYPNPFNPSTSISYALAGDGMVSLKIYDLLGREVSTLVNEYQQSNNYNVNFNAGNLASGIYIYRLAVDGNIIGVKKMILLR